MLMVARCTVYLGGSELTSLEVKATALLSIGTLIWPCRVVRTTLLFNYMASMVHPSLSESVPAAVAAVGLEGRVEGYRYSNITDVLRRVRRCMGWRELLRNSFDVGITSSLSSVVSDWLVVQLVTQWLRGTVGVLLVRGAFFPQYFIS